MDINFFVFRNSQRVVKSLIQNCKFKAARWGIYSIKKCEPLKGMFVSRQDRPFGTEDMKTLKNRVSKWQNDQIADFNVTVQSESLIGTKIRCQEAQAHTNKLIRALRRIVGSIRAAFNYYFVPEPANIAFFKVLNKLDGLLSGRCASGAKMNPKQLKKVCEDLEKIICGRKLEQDVDKQACEIFCLTSTLVDACTRGEFIIPEPDGGDGGVVQKPGVLQARELTEQPENSESDDENLDVLGELDEVDEDYFDALDEQPVEESLDERTIEEYFDALSLPYRSGLWPELSPAQLAVIPDGKGQAQTQDIQSLAKMQDFKTILSLQKAFPNEFKVATNFPAKFLLIVEPRAIESALRPF